MTDALRGLKEKMEFDHEFHAEKNKNLYHDYPYAEGYRLQIAAKTGAERENKILQAIVLKEVAELVEAVDAYEKEFKNPAIDVLYRRTLREQIFKTLAKFRGKKE